MSKRKQKRGGPGAVVAPAPPPSPSKPADAPAGDAGDESSVAGAIPRSEVVESGASVTTLGGPDAAAAASDFAGTDGDKTAVDVDVADVDATVAAEAHDDDDDHSGFAAPEDTAVDVAHAAVEIVGEEDAVVEEDLPEAAVAAGVADEALPDVEGSRLESIIESLLFAADRPLLLSDLKRLLGSRDGKRITETLEGLRERRGESGIQLVSVAGGWQLRTHPGNGAWVAKLVAGRPPRLSRAMMETLSIVAYRQPITRPEIDEIRGVDCGPVLHTLLDRSLIRVIGKKEEVGRPILYGTTPEFLKVFSLRDLTDLPTLREFHELAADDRAKVDASTGGASEAEAVAPTDAQRSGDNDGAGVPDGLGHATSGLAGPRSEGARDGMLSEVDPEEEDGLIEALDRATEAAGRASRSVADPDASVGDGGTDTAGASTSSEAGEP